MMYLSATGRVSERAASAMPKYRPDIDGLRAVAVLSVVIFHAFPKSLPGGFVGVDIFFVISGFLISSIILRGADLGSFSFLDFYARRVRRIFPALAIVLATTLAIGRVTLLPDEFSHVAKHVVAGALFVSNFALWNEAGYFDTASNLKPLLHLWSLGIEEQFYLLWPAAILLAMRARRFILLLISLCCLLSFGLAVVQVHDYPVATFYSPATRFWELFIGATLAAAALDGKLATLVRHSYARETCGAIGALLIVASLWALRSGQPVPGWRSLMPTIGAAMVIAAGPNAWSNRRLLSTRAAVGVGLISYPLYLWHWPLLAFFRILGPYDFPPGRLWEPLVKWTIILSAVGLAFATYRLLELRVRSRRPPKFVAGLATSMLLVGTLGAVSFYSTPLNPLTWEDARWHTDACLAQYGLEASPKPFCVQLHPEKSPTVILIGDSNANHWVPGIARADANTALLHLGSGACPMFDGVSSIAPGQDLATQQICYRTAHAAAQIIRTTPSARSVIITERLTEHIPGPLYNGMTAGPSYLLKSDTGDGGSNESIYSAGLRRTLTELSALHKQVTFVMQVPELGFSPADCVSLRWIDAFRTLRQQCAERRADVERRQRPSRQAVLTVLHDFPAVRILDPMEVLCDATWCQAMADGRLLYRDPDHLSEEGSAYVWQRMGGIGG